MTLHDLGLGVDKGNEKVSIFLYADDVGLIPASEMDIQSILDIILCWYEKWGVLINTNKSKCVHFRNARTTRS